MVDILKLDVRTELLKHLIEHEINYKSKKKPKNYKLKRFQYQYQYQYQNQNLLKLHHRQKWIPLIEVRQRLYIHNQLNQTSKTSRKCRIHFETFRTRPTPVPSPQSSPKRGAFPTFTGSLSSGASTTKLPTPPLSQPTTTNQLLPAASHHTNRGRSLSNSFITPRIEIEFEN